MSQDIRDFVTSPCDLLALGEPTHREPAFARVRNELFAQLVGRGFRSIALETDRVAALAVNDYVREGAGTLDTALGDSFSHGFGELAANRQLVAWMREFNRNRPPEERLAFHGFDAPTETMGAPSPRRYLELARDYLRFDVDVASLAGDDERWSRPEAVMDPAASPGDTAEAERLRSIADDMLDSLDTRAPELIATTSRAEWQRVRTHLTAGLGLLRYHRQSARCLDRSARLSDLMAVRGALMAQNLLDIRTTEARRGPTLVHAQNLHLQKNPSNWEAWNLSWIGVGVVAGALLGDRYSFVAGSLGRSEALGLGEPEPDTYEGLLQSRVTTWGLVAATTVTSASVRTDTTPQQGYFPLHHQTVDGADAILHIADAGRPVGR
ncbi:erythromycin esterase family protein [Streptomyces kaniharaensis]|uniref:Erythromycin esterase family protein n=1 Tax=Streptomyces kaniharaensis TaxID=212423 RepID=A0A6N7KYY1_9ACTN|nr:erythromycin esterase family protein [Streptomyces kaniharaensis]MQS15769.1 erythromycin esterase family protein [Streptomyces kaniharaensis]